MQVMVVCFTAAALVGNGAITFSVGEGELATAGDGVCDGVCDGVGDGVDVAMGVGEGVGATTSTRFVSLIEPI